MKLESKRQYRLGMKLFVVNKHARGVFQDRLKAIKTTTTKYWREENIKSVEYKVGDFWYEPNLVFTNIEGAKECLLKYLKNNIKAYEYSIKQFDN